MVTVHHREPLKAPVSTSGPVWVYCGGKLVRVPVDTETGTGVCVCGRVLRLVW